MSGTGGRGWMVRVLVIAALGPPCVGIARVIAKVVGWSEPGAGWGDDPQRWPVALSLVLPVALAGLAAVGVALGRRRAFELAVAWSVLGLVWSVSAYPASGGAAEVVPMTWFALALVGATAGLIGSGRAASAPARSPELGFALVASTALAYGALFDLRQHDAESLHLGWLVRVGVVAVAVLGPLSVWLTRRRPTARAVAAGTVMLAQLALAWPIARASLDESARQLWPALVALSAIVTLVVVMRAPEYSARGRRWARLVAAAGVVALTLGWARSATDELEARRAEVEVTQARVLDRARELPEACGDEKVADGARPPARARPTSTEWRTLAEAIRRCEARLEAATATVTDRDRLNRTAARHWHRALRSAAWDHEAARWRYTRVREAGAVRLIAWLVGAPSAWPHLAVRESLAWPAEAE